MAYTLCLCWINTFHHGNTVRWSWSVFFWWAFSLLWIQANMNFPYLSMSATGTPGSVEYRYIAGLWRSDVEGCPESSVSHGCVLNVLLCLLKYWHSQTILCIYCICCCTLMPTLICLTYVSPVAQKCVEFCKDSIVKMSTEQITNYSIVAYLTWCNILWVYRPVSLVS